ncbi:citrate synthase-like protein [Obelidium mucronatum]|nr:citrate synthase-like protein [Obelidium mucronatum]
MSEEHFLTVHDPKTNTTIKVPINATFNTIPSSAFAGPQDCSNHSPSSLMNRQPLCASTILVNGHLPSKAENDNWTQAIMSHTYVHTELEKQMTTFRYDAHPMGMLIATIASLSTFHPDANPALQGDGMYMKPKGADAKQIAKATANRNRAIYRILGKVPTMASYAYRNRIGRTYNAPMPNCNNYAENFLYMIDKLNEPEYIPDARIVKILDKMFILLAEHGSNCSTITMRHLASSGVDPYTALSGSYGALFGERKAAAVMGMLHLIGTPSNVPQFLQLVKEKKCIHKNSSTGTLEFTEGGKPTRLQGFGHRIYKSMDPRVKIAKSLALELFELIGKGEMGDLALALEEAALADSWFQSRHLFTNIDFWTAIVFHTLGFPADMFPVLTAIPRTAGLVAHWQESLDDPEYKIYRPRQIFNGAFVRDYVGDRAGLDEVVGDDEAAAASVSDGYAKSLPAEANKRLSLNSGGIEEAKLAEFKNMIERTKHSIQELSALTGGSPTGSNKPPSPKSGYTKIGAWVMGKSSSNDLYASEKLAKTQKELQDLLQQQQELLELYMVHRSQQQQQSQNASPEKVVSKSPSLNKLNAP